MLKLENTHALRDRLRWRREEIVATLEATDPAVVARSLAYLFAIGGLLVLAFPALPGAQLRHPEMTLVPVVLALATSVALIVVYDRTPAWILTALPSFGTVLVTYVVIGSTPSAGPAVVFLYFWVVLAGVYFSGLRTGAAHLAGVGLGFGVAVIAADIPQGLMLWLMGMSSLTVTGVLLHLLRQRADTLILRLDEAAKTDPLTGLANRRAFDALFDEELYRAQRTARPLTLMLVDLDGLKTINDEYGHAAGDVALRVVADVLRAQRRTDRSARLGGDEFAILLPDTGTAGAALVAKRLVAAVRETAGYSFPVTLSMGIACTPGDGATAEDLHHAADTALYAAKRRGGDQAVQKRLISGSSGAV
ncbi:MAG TPA: GGDEF domain-containing protein [Thermoleophilaceae bacterium]|nr:GGDEF domain-containing protein [Thermoleophilaceae bacterium]